MCPSSAFLLHNARKHEACLFFLKQVAFLLRSAVAMVNGPLQQAAFQDRMFGVL
jgi:hypothetical protein